MAKKNKKAAPLNPAASASIEETERAESPAPDASFDSPSTTQEDIKIQAQPEAEAPVVVEDIKDDSSAEQLEALKELEAAKREILSMKVQLAEKDAEIAELKSRATLNSGAGAPVASNEHIEKLQDRLLLLKKEQAEADTARESAWRQLKSVVAEISRLAVPDAKAASTASTPTGAGIVV